jgi:hypothetical protein
MNPLDGELSVTHSQLKMATIIWANFSATFLTEVKGWTDNPVVYYRVSGPYFIRIFSSVGLDCFLDFGIY